MNDHKLTNVNSVNICALQVGDDIVHDKFCNVLGRYCWTHRSQTDAGVPGWARPQRGEFVRRSPWGGCVYNSNGATIGLYGYTEQIVWANGDTEDPKRGTACSECHSTACPTPVVGAGDYGEIISKKSYWNWLEGNASVNEETGTHVEPPMAAPDELQG